MATLDLVPGEEVILRVALNKENWKCWRCVQCSMPCICSFWGAPIALFYGIFGGSCRQKEADSFELVLTNQNLHYRHKLYQCGICCQNSSTKIIPLEKIQDIELISDYWGDCCGYAEKPGEVYKLFVQTAAMMGRIPELAVFCIQEPREFKRAVLAAKNRVSQDTHIVGQSKTVEVTATKSTPDVDRILSLLERQVQENSRLTTLLAQQGKLPEIPAL
jgi:hypothetical protein